MQWNKTLVTGFKKSADYTLHFTTNNVCKGTFAVQKKTNLFQRWFSIHEYKNNHILGSSLLFINIHQEVLIIKKFNFCCRASAGGRPYSWAIWDFWFNDSMVQSICDCSTQYRKWSPTANDPETANDPQNGPQMILDRKWSLKSTANDPESKIGMTWTQVSGSSCRFYCYCNKSD